MLRVTVLELVFQSLCLLAINSKVKSIYLLFLYLTILFLTVLLYDKETKDKYIGLTFESIACILGEELNRIKLKHEILHT